MADANVEVALTSSAATARRERTAMDSAKILPQEQVVRLVAQADSREFSLFLGAGASRSSGVVLASEMIREWRELAFREQAGPNEAFEAWCARQPWFGTPTEYSDLFEVLYPDERARQKYVEPKIESAFPGWCYVYLANIVREGHFNLVFTTNFDDLVNEALTRFIGYNAVVCAADSEVATINVATARAKVVKLHGDYLFKSLKNTRDELERLTANMGRKFAEFSRQCGMVVLGYAGADESIMSALATLLDDVESFPNGIYWGVHDVAAPLPVPLERLVAAHPKRLRLFRCEDFDVFMALLHERLRLPAPMTIAEPLKAARTTFDRLLAQTTQLQRVNTTIRAHAERLAEQLGGSIAQVSEAASLDLFDAQIALGSRDHAGALARVERYSASHPDDAQALTIWGSALMIQSEEDGAGHLAEQAAAKWREAVRSDPKWAVARYNLVRYHALRQEYREAIAEAEALLELAPRDANLRLNLAQLYGSAGRTREGLQTVERLLALDPDNPVLHVTRAALLEQRGRPVEALGAIQRALQIAPANPWVRIQAAQGYVRTGRPLEAASEFNQAIQLDPRNTSFRIQAAMFFLGTNQAAQALLHLREAARLEPDASEVRGWLATAHMAMGTMADAQREIETALQIDPNESRLLATAGQIYATNNQPDRAEQCLQRAIEANPHAIGPYGVLAQLYARWQRPAQLNMVMQRIAQLDPVAARQIQQQLQAPFAGSPGVGQGATPMAAAARKFFDWLGSNDGSGHR